MAAREFDIKFALRADSTGKPSHQPKFAVSTPAKGSLGSAKVIEWFFESPGYLDIEVCARENPDGSMSVPCICGFEVFSFDGASRTRTPRNHSPRDYLKQQHSLRHKRSSDEAQVQAARNHILAGMALSPWMCENQGGNFLGWGRGSMGKTDTE